MSKNHEVLLCHISECPHVNYLKAKKKVTGDSLASGKQEWRTSVLRGGGGCKCRGLSTCGGRRCTDGEHERWRPIMGLLSPTLSSHNLGYCQVGCR